MITKRYDHEQNCFFYEMESTCNMGDVSIKVDAENGGHGCLFGIEVPPMSIKGFCWSSDKKNPEMEDVFKVLNYILKEYNCEERIVRGKTEEL